MPGGFNASGLGNYDNGLSDVTIANKVKVRRQQYRHTCAKCGARRVDAQIGLEETIEEYLETMVGVFRLVHEVMDDSATLWLNIGDQFVKKQLQGVPWRVAFALQADHWYLRSDCIWHKPNPMPESAQDRPTKSHDYLFLLSKRANYYYDAEAIREPATYGNHRRTVFDNVPPSPPGQPPHVGLRRTPGPEAGRNKRSVWTIASDPSQEQHYASFPRKLVEPCILAGTSEKGHCPECGARWERVVDVSYTPGSGSTGGRRREAMPGDPRSDRLPKLAKSTATLAWQPTCTHDLEPIPDIVLDPFGGTGTVGRVAQDLGRHAILIDLNPAYVEMAKKRTAQTGLVLST